MNAIRACFPILVAACGQLLHAAPGDLAALNAQIVGSEVSAAVPQPDGKIILVGDFTSVLGTDRNHVARLNADGSLDAGFNPNVGSAVGCVAVLPDGKILIGGNFSTVGGVARSRIARLNPDGSLDSTHFTPPNPNGEIRTIVPQANGKILIGGLFSNVSGSSRLARLNANGTVDSAFAPGIAAEVRSISIQSGKILFCGLFTGRIDRVNADGTQDATFTGSSSATSLDALALQADGKILIAGNGGGNLRRLQSNGAADSSFVPSLNGRVYGVAVQSDGKILVAGAFTTPKPYLLRLNPDGTTDTAFDPRPNKASYGCALQADGKILATGDFESLQPNGASTSTARNGFALLENDPATQALAATSSTAVSWTRGGTAQDLERATFEQSIDGGFNWNFLGNGTRVGTTPSWELTGLTLPPNGLLRARGTTRGGVFCGSAGLVEQTSAYNLVHNLAWDPGSESGGTEVYTTTYSNGGQYVFRVITENTDFDAWRAALKVTSGEADLYWSQGSIPTTTTFQGSSTLSGSDGFVKQLGTINGAGQEWYFLVVATEGSSWSFLAGDVHVEELGALAADASSSSGLAPVGPEGARFFRTSIPSDTLAWRLWVNDGTNTTVPANVYTRPDLVGQPLWHERGFVGQDLLVPGSSPSSHEFVAGSGQPYFVSIYAAPGTPVALDNRKQTVTNLPYQHTTGVVSASGYRYHTYRVQVPVEQIAWEATSIRVGGDPDLAVRRNEVPNGRINEFESEVEGSPSDSVTVVPNILTEGTYLITVHSDADFSFRLFNGEPEITAIPFDGSVTNTDTDRVGWRFFRIGGALEDQVGQFGWALSLTGQATGTEIFTRRNAVPGKESGLYALRSGSGVLQEPGHQADYWYVGVYLPTAALGPFTLHSGPINPPTVTMNGGTHAITNLPPQQWDFVRVDVPAQIAGEDVLGWELRVKDWSGGNPQMVVRRAQLSDQLGNRYSDGGPMQYPAPWGLSTFPPGQQHMSSHDQWTERSNVSGADSGVDRVLSLPMGNPLEPGTYYVGVFNSDSAQSCAFTLLSRAVGNGMSLNITNASVGNQVPVNGLSPRSPAYFRYVVPPGVTGWQFNLGFGAATPDGEGMLVLRKDFVPNSQWPAYPVGAPYQTLDGTLTYPLRLENAGEDRLTILPPNGGTEIPPGTYYAMVVGEGRDVPNSSWIGDGAVDFTLANSPSVPVEDLGTVNFGSIVSREGNLLAGENRFFRFDLPPSTLALSITLNDAVGNATVHMRTSSFGLPYGPTSAYGLVGGQPDQQLVTNQGTYTISNPAAGEYVLLVRDVPGTTASAFDLEIEAEGASSLDFDGASTSVTALKPNRWRYYQVTVPSQVEGEDVLGWELRVKDWTGGNPWMVVRRDLPPVQISGTVAYSSSTFPTGEQVYSGGDPWTGRSNAAGDDAGVDRVLSLTMGNPLEPGTYYIGVYNQSTANCAFTLQSRAIGKGMSLDVQDAAIGSPVNISGLAPREPRFFKYEVPAGTASWQFQLGFGVGTPDGEGLLVLRKDLVPNPQLGIGYQYAPYQILSGSVTHQCGLDIAGEERVTILPASGQTEIPAGTYYAMVVSEGNSPLSGYNRIGTGAVDFTLENSTPVPVEDLGTVNFGSVISEAGSLLAGENRYFRFTVPPSTLALSVTLNNQPGSSSAYFRTAGGGLPSANSAYGLVGGESYQHSVVDQGTVTISNPAAGEYVLLVRDVPGTTSSAFDLEIEAEGSLPLDFDGASASVTALKPDRWRYYQVTVPSQVEGEDVLGWELRVKDWTGGNPQMVVRRDLVPVQTNGTVPYYSSTFPTGQQLYSVNDQWTYRSNADGTDAGVDRVLSLAMGSPLEPGTYYVGVYNLGTANCAFTLQSRAIGKGMSLDVQDVLIGSPVNISGLAPREPRFFKFVLPTATPSWRFQLGFGAGTPNGEGLLVLRKNLVPNTQIGISYQFAPYQTLSGSVTYQCGLKIEGEERVTILPASGQTEIPAGNYYAMVVSEGNSPVSSTRIGTGAVDFTLENSTPVPVEHLGTVSTSAPLTDTSLVVKGGVQFYRYTVASASWPLEVRLTALNGSNPFVNLRTAGGQLASNGSLYGVVGGEGASASLYPGNSVVTLAAPPIGEHSLTVSPWSTGSSAEFQLSIVQKTPRPMTFSSQLAGEVSNIQNFNLLSGQYEFFEVTMPPLIDGQVFLGWLLHVQTTTGTAIVSARKDQLPIASGGTYETGGSSTRLYVGDKFYQAEGGVVDLLPGTWYVQLQASGNAQGTVTSEAIFANPLNFDASQNADGGSHIATGQLGTGEKKFYVVTVPDTLNGKDVIAWNLRLVENSGNATVRVSPNTLPISSGATVHTDSRSDDDLLLDQMTVPPGTYYVEVEGNSATEYTLTSDALTTADVDQAWEMPARGGAVTTPGLTTPDPADPSKFGDTGIQADGNPIPNSQQGIDIAAGGFDLYTVVVPEGNEGILRAQLDAISGNPDLYIRRGALRSESGVHDYNLNQNVNTQYGNWVASDARIAKQLPPGVYYLVVEAASGTTARYRLRLSTGRIQDLAMSGGSAANVPMAGGDWRYFRVDVPLDLPQNWQVSYALSQGAGTFYIRDTVPPGPDGQSLTSSIKSWATDQKNKGTYTTYSSPTTVTFSPPQVRPGHTYYLGFQSTTDSTISVTSLTSGTTRTDPSLLAFENGTVTDTLLPGEKRYFRIPVPATATRWKHTSSHAASVWLYLEQGSFPSETSTDDWWSGGAANSSRNQAMTGVWPWVGGESYYLAVVNTAATNQAFSFTMNGESPLADTDGDGIPDAWENQYLGGLTQGANSDLPDRDGTPLLLEHFFGMDPTQPDRPHFKPRREGNEFVIEFRKRQETPLVSQQFQWNPSVQGGWTVITANLSKLADAGDMELWEARMAIPPLEPTGFYRMQVTPLP